MAMSRPLKRAASPVDLDKDDSTESDSPITPPTPVQRPKKRVRCNADGLEGAEHGKGREEHSAYGVEDAEGWCVCAFSALRTAL